MGRGLLTIIALMFAFAKQAMAVDGERHAFLIGNFKTESGAVLPEAKLMYATYPNVPVPALPELHETKLYMIIRGLAREGAHEGREVGWGAFAIKVNGPEIMEILESGYGDLENLGRIAALAKYVKFARELGTEGYAALIGAEM